MRTKFNKETGKEEIQYSLAEHIFIVLQANKDNGNEFMTDSDIAIDVMQRVKTLPKDKYKRKIIQPKSIRGAMGDVRNLADSEGMTIVTDRKATDKKNFFDGWIIDGWRIATEQDKDYIEQELKIRALREDGYSDSQKRIKNTATASGILPSEKRTAIDE